MNDMMSMPSSEPIDFMAQSYTAYFNLRPFSVKGAANHGTQFYKRILYNKAYSAFKFKLLDYWHLNWFRFWLFQYGSIVFVYTKKYGWIAQPYTVMKFDYDYNPKVILVTNAYLKERIIGHIGTNAAIVHLFDDYYGIDDIVTRYAEMLAQCDRSINISLMNSNITYLFEAESKKQAQEVKDAYGKATSGEPLVLLNKSVEDGTKITTLFPNVKSNFIAPDILEARRAIINAFLTEIGIRNVSVQKKERLTQGETNENNDETRALVEIMFTNMRRGFRAFNEISGENTGVELTYSYQSQSSGNVSREISANKEGTK